MSTGPLTIAVDVREWRRGTSTGLARFLVNFLRWAANHGRHRLVLLGNQHTEARVPGVPLFRRRESVTPWWDQVALPALLRHHAADVFLSPYYKAPLWSPCPCVVAVHDLIPLRHVEGGSTATASADAAGGRAAAGPVPGERGGVEDADAAIGRAGGASRPALLRTLLLRRWMGLSIRRATCIVTASEHARREIVDLYAVPPERIRVVPIGLDAAFATPPPAAVVEETRRRHGLDGGYVLYVGRFAPHKNVPTLVHAWQRLPDGLRRRHPLVLAGAGTPPAGPGIVTPGLVPDADLPGLYGGAAVFAFPSRHEGFGLPPLEAMACGTPVVCADATSLPEVVGDAALRVPPDDVAAWTAALRRLLEDDGLRRRLAARGRDRAALFTPDRTAPRLQELLEEAAR